MRQQAWNALIVSSGISTSTAFTYIGHRYFKADSILAQTGNSPTFEKSCPDDFRQSGGRGAKGILATSALRDSRYPRAKRTNSTAANEYYAEHGSLPPPATVHFSLPESRKNELEDRDIPGNNILIIGDVHGCYDELVFLHQKAVEENDQTPFQYVILVGDLCNKGPLSVRVIHHVRSQNRWLSIRGNHDDAALKAALGDVRRRQGKKYRWVTDTSKDEDILTDEDVLWLSALPYTIRIPGSMLQDSVDTVIVHAGLIPNVPLEDQTVETMVTLREVQKNQSSGQYIYQGKRQKNESEEDFGAPQPWASVWQGPYRVVFGHDARRGLQRYSGDWAIGLDTGACYGKKLTGLILPERKLVSVDSLKVHCPISRD